MRHLKLALLGLVMWIIPTFLDLPSVVEIIFYFFFGGFYGLILKDLLNKENDE